MDDCVAQNTTLHDLKADLAALFGDLDKVITALEDRNQVMAPVWKNASDDWNALNQNRGAIQRCCEISLWTFLDMFLQHFIA